jgi:hypothetical protein
MKIAFLVVYVFNDDHLRLFQIHLERIRRHTSVPFKIFGAGHKLSGKVRAHVERQPEIELFDLPVPKSFGVRQEHAFCLEELTKRAMAEGFTHFMALHLDSFPLRDDWLDNLLASLEEGAALATLVPNGFSAGLLWTRDFQEHCKPRMLVPSESRDTPEFKAFTAAYPDIDHVETGLGYIWRAWELGLPWRALRTDEERKIYDDLLYHMVGATFRTWIPVQKIRNEVSYRALWRVVGPISRFLPPGGRDAVRRRFIDPDRMTRDGSMRSKEEEIQDLMDDPVGYLTELRKRARSGRAPASRSPGPASDAYETFEQPV